MQRDDASVQPASSKSTRRSLRIFFVVILVVMTIQGWFGDTVNIFFAPATPISKPPFSIGGFLQTINGVGFTLVFHAFEGILLVVLGTISVALAFVWSHNRSVRICAILGAFFAVSAAAGGFLFVMSGFSAGGNSAQMGGSFIGAYALYFIALYYSK